MAFILISLPSTCHTKITLASNASGIREGLQTTKERTQPSDGHKAEPNTTEPPIVLQRLLLVERRSKVAMLRGEDMGTQLKVGQLKANSKGNEGATKGNEMRGESSSVPATTEEDIVTRRRGRSSSSRKDDELQELIFPKRLMAILSDPNNIDCIQWGSEGASFYIVDREIFAAKIMPRLSTRQAKFSSFVRKLNRW